MTVTTRTPRPARRRVATVAAVVGTLLAVLAAAALVAALVRSGSSTESGPKSPGTGSNPAQGSGHAVTEHRDVAPFTAVELAGSAPVSVHVGPARSVTVSADDNLVDHVTTEVRSSTLVIGTTGSFSTRAPLRVSVTVPTLDAATLSGSGTLEVTGVRGGRLHVTLSGSGRLSVAGHGERVAALLSGSGSLALGDLMVREAEARLTGAGQIVVFATERLTADLSGTGSIRYGGDPARVAQRVTGTGSIAADG